jgi:membrane protease YdiL (CAAX protease family)
MTKKSKEEAKKESIWKIGEIFKLQFVWYLSLALVALTQLYNFPNIPDRFNALVHYSFSIIIKLFIIAYLLYVLLIKKDLPLTKIGLSAKSYIQDILLGIKISCPFFLLTILLINLQHQNLTFNKLFQPLIKINSLEELIISLFYLFLLTILTLIPAATIELFYRIIIYNFFKEKLGTLLGSLICSTYYSFTLLKPELLIIHFLIGLISVYLYERTNSLIPAIIWQSFYQSTIILYIFGFQFLYSIPF